MAWPGIDSAHGFDNNSDALDISHVNIAKYVEAADKTLALAIATQPHAPTVRTQRLSLAQPGGFVAHILGNGDGVLLRDMKPDPEFPPAGETTHIDEGAHERMGTFERGSTVGLFRHEDESFSPANRRGQKPARPRAAGNLHTPDVLHSEVERLLKDAKSQRFIEDFPGQWQTSQRWKTRCRNAKCN